MITQSECRELLSYCPETGEFRWRVDRNFKVRAGALAGTMRKGGYIWISINGRHYGAHRLAWLLMRGNLPGKDLDHRNGNPSDNRWANLRYATRSQNAQNSKVRSSSKSGLKGVSFHKASGKCGIA